MAYDRQSGIYAQTGLRKSENDMQGYHCHADFELFHVESGSCRLFVNEHIFDLHPGDFVLIPPMVLHFSRYLFGTCRRSLVFFKREQIPDAITDLMPYAASFFAELRIFRVPEAYRGQMDGFLQQMVQEEKIHDTRSPQMVSLLFQELLILCSRVCTFLNDLPVEIHTTDQQLLNAARYIRENYMRTLTIEDIAHVVGFSPNYLNRRFRQASGMGLHEYLVFVRLSHAAEELRATEDSITIIAFRCGFSDSNYFKDAFKKKYGLAPRDYRKMH